MQFVCDTCKEDLSARKRRKLGNSLYVEYMHGSLEHVIVFILFVKL